MKLDSPIYTFYSIIAATIVALIISHVNEIPGEKAMPLFIGAMALGVVLGEIIERLQRKSKAR